MCSHLLQRTAGEVASTERLDALPQGAVQHRLGPALGVQEEEFGEGQREELQPGTETATQFRVDDACDKKTPEVFRTWAA